MGSNSIVLSSRGLTACYGRGSEHPVLKQVSIDVGAKEIVGLLGPNGSGKSSTLKAMLGQLTVLEGSVHFNGEEITNLPTETIVGKGVRLFPQGGRVFSDLTVDENLRVAASLAPRGTKISTQKAYDWFPDLAPRSTTRAGLLSGGQRQMLSLGTVLLYMQVEKPLVFLLDEPSGSLDPPHRKRLAEVLREARDRFDAPILLAEENALFAKEVCDRYYQFVDPGQVEPLE